MTTFADGLNIPIGIYPYKNGVIAWSIPNIWYFQDTDGDGIADNYDDCPELAGTIKNNGCPDAGDPDTGLAVVTRSVVDGSGLT